MSAKLRKHVGRSSTKEGIAILHGAEFKDMGSFIRDSKTNGLTQATGSGPNGWQKSWLSGGCQ